MNRRSNEIKGHVNFPIEKYPNENEGGMYVQLVVVAREPDLPVCCGGFCNILKNECFMSDGSPDALESIEFDTIGDEKFPSVYKYDQRHFPNYKLPEEFNSPERKIAWDWYGRYLSINYLAVILLGSTGWSCGEWSCTYEDLTDAGKEIWESMRNLYPNSDIYLQTWLDT